MQSALQSAWDEFWRLYRAGQFFAAHEALEDLWRESVGEPKQRLQGFIHGAVAREHHMRGNAEGAARQVLRMRSRLKSYGDCAEFCDEVEKETSASLALLDGAARERLARLEEWLRKKHN